jgi:hypothetical protein
MEALGDVKQLQHEQLRKAQGIDYQTNPPIQVPTRTRAQAHARLPGGVMFVDAAGAQGGVRSAFEIQLNLQHLLADIQDVRERIRGAFYADLFLMLANDQRSGITATEVAERHEEKLLMLGPVLERLHNELLSPMIDMTFDYASDAGILPEPPEELQGQELNIEFISTLAQAQRMVSAQGMDRLLGSNHERSHRHPRERAGPGGEGHRGRASCRAGGRGFQVAHGAQARATHREPTPRRQRHVPHVVLAERFRDLLQGGSAQPGPAPFCTHQRALPRAVAADAQRELIDDHRDA